MGDKYTYNDEQLLPERSDTWELPQNLEAPSTNQDFLETNQKTSKTPELRNTAAISRNRDYSN